jgi:hypothetical protein
MTKLTAICRQILQALAIGCVMGLPAVIIVYLQSQPH